MAADLAQLFLDAIPQPGNDDLRLVAVDRLIEADGRIHDRVADPRRREARRGARAIARTGRGRAARPLPRSPRHGRERSPHLRDRSRSRRTPDRPTRATRPPPRHAASSGPGRAAGARARRARARGARAHRRRWAWRDPPPASPPTPSRAPNPRRARRGRRA